MAKWFRQQITHVACNITQFTKHIRFFRMGVNIYKTQTPLHNRNFHRFSIPTGALFPQVFNSPKLHIGGGLGAGGWGLGLGAPGPHGPVVPLRVPKAVRPSKEAVGGAAQSSRRTTSPRFQLKSFENMIDTNPIRKYPGTAAYLLDLGKI